VPQTGADNWFWIRSWRCSRCEQAATLRVDRVLGIAAHDLLSPWQELRATQQAEPVVPLSWQRADDAAHLQRIATAARTARMA